MNISKDTICRLQGLEYNPVSLNDNCDEVSFDQGTVLYINYTSLKAPKKKEITVDWILSKLNKNSLFDGLSGHLKKVLGNKSGFSIYATSYGIGVEALRNMESNAMAVTDLLNSLGIRFKNEFSESGWVFRFVVSKDKENMRLISAL